MNLKVVCALLNMTVIVQFMFLFRPCTNYLFLYLAFSLFLIYLSLYLALFLTFSVYL